MSLSDAERKELEEQSDYKFGDVQRDGTVNDPALKEYNIFDLAERQADFIQNRQVRERAEREAKLAQRLAAAEQEPETDGG